MLSRAARTIKTAKTVMKAIPLNPNPPFSGILRSVGAWAVPLRSVVMY